MLPLDPLGAVGLGAGLVTAAAMVDPTAGAAGPLPLATTIEGAVIVTVMVDLLTSQHLGGFEAGGCGKSGGKMENTGNNSQNGTTGSEH